MLLRASGFYSWIESYEKSTTSDKEKSKGSKAQRSVPDPGDDEDEIEGVDVSEVAGVTSSDDKALKKLLKRLAAVKDLEKLAGKRHVYVTSQTLDDEDALIGMLKAAGLGEDGDEGIEGGTGGPGDASGADWSAFEVQEVLEGAGEPRGGAQGSAEDPVPVGVTAVRQFCDYSKMVSGEENDDTEPTVRGLVLRLIGMGPSRTRDRLEAMSAHPHCVKRYCMFLLRSLSTSLGIPAPACACHMPTFLCFNLLRPPPPTPPCAHAGPDDDAARVQGQGVQCVHHHRKPRRQVSVPVLDGPQYQHSRSATRGSGMKMCLKHCCLSDQAGACSMPLALSAEQLETNPSYQHACCFRLQITDPLLPMHIHKHTNAHK